MKKPSFLSRLRSMILLLAATMLTLQGVWAGTYTVTAVTDPAEVGTVDYYVNHTLTSLRTFETGTVVELMVPDNMLYRFTQWDDGNTDNVRSVKVEDRDINLIAWYDEILAGSGTQADPYRIDSEADMDSLCVRVERAAKGTPFYAELASDISLGAAFTSSIGSESKPFYGEFNGNNHTITCQTDRNNVHLRNGLFRYVKDAYIHDITLTGGIYAEESNVGTVVGTADGNTRVCNIVSSVGISNWGTGKEHIGGIVGRIRHSDGDSVQLKGCSYSGTIHADYNVNTLGGIVGYCEPNANVGIEYCWFSGWIDGDECDSNQYEYIGGILGYADDNGDVQNFKYLRHCVSTGTLQPCIRKTFATYTHEGTIVGSPRGKVPNVISDNCYVSATEMTMCGNGKNDDAKNHNNKRVFFTVKTGDDNVASTQWKYICPTDSTPTLLEATAVMKPQLASCYTVSDWSGTACSDNPMRMNLTGDFTTSDTVLIAHFVGNHTWDGNGECINCHMRQSVPYRVANYVTANDPTSGIAGWDTLTATNVRTIYSTSDSLVLTAGWYYVADSVGITRGAICEGDVHLILCDGAQFNVTNTNNNDAWNVAGIRVSQKGESLTVYGQSEDETMGALTTVGNSSGAGIGGDYHCGGHNITIHGGRVTATGGVNAAGIGSGGIMNGDPAVKAENITINGGIVTAKGQTGGAGIGGGWSGDASKICINGGDVTAFGEWRGAGIGGGGNFGYADSIFINGGVIHASNNGDLGSGIGGGGSCGRLSNLRVHGGTIYAHSTGGEAIGAGNRCCSDTGRCSLLFDSDLIVLVGDNSPASTPLIHTGSTNLSYTFGHDYATVHTHVWDENDECTFEGCPYHRNISYRVPTYNTDDLGFQKAELGIADWSTQVTVAQRVSSASQKLTWVSDWYYVSDTVVLTGGVECTGAVRLILGDSALLTVTNSNADQPGIRVGETGTSFSVYAQCDDEQMGALSVTGAANAAGIGSGTEHSGADISIHGGRVTARGGENGAGIGGGNGKIGQNIAINAGVVTAIGGDSAAAIGGGKGDLGQNIWINGGKVLVTGGANGAGIGGGIGEAGSFIVINNGTVIARGGKNSAGIGGGNGASGRSISIHGGSVTARGGQSAAGIGGGYHGIANMVKIDGGAIVASAGKGQSGDQGGAAIGAGEDPTSTQSYITIDEALKIYGSNLISAGEEIAVGHTSTHDITSALAPYRFVSINRQNYFREMNYEWGTLTVPFDIVYDADNHNYRLYYPSEIDLSGDEGNITLTSYEDGALIEAGTPLFVKAQRECLSATNSKYYLHAAGTPQSDVTAKTVDLDNHFHFRGILQDDNRKDIYFMARNQLWYADVTTTIPANRALLYYMGPAVSTPSRFTIMEAGESEVVTALENETPSDSPSRGEGEKISKLLIDGRMYILRGENLYDMNGRKY